MKALIDLEYYLYRIASACEYEIEWEPDVWTYACRHDEAKDGIQQFIGSVREALPDCEQIILAVGDRASFRYGIWPQYKANRRPKPPSLKEQAFNDLADAYNADKIDDTTYENIRLALEALPDG